MGAGCSSCGGASIVSSMVGSFSVGFGSIPDEQMDTSSSGAYVSHSATKLLIHYNFGSDTKDKRQWGKGNG